jgi:hypothetical protein
VRHAQGCACAIGEFACFTKATRFGGPQAFGRGGRCRPAAVLASRASGTAVAALVACAVVRTTTRRSRAAGGRFLRRRVNAGSGCRSAMPSIHREPLPRSALSSARLQPCLDARLVADPSSRRHRWRRSVFRPIAPGPRSRISLPARPRFSGPGMPPDDFCNLYDARAHPASSRSSLASGALGAPLLAGTRGAGCVGCHDALPHRAPASHDLRAATCARRAPLTWTGQIVSQITRGRRALLDERGARPSRSVPCTRVTGAYRRELWSVSRRSAQA